MTLRNLLVENINYGCQKLMIEMKTCGNNVYSLWRVSPDNEVYSN